VGTRDPREAFRQQQIENEPGVALIGFLFAHFTGANLGGVADPKFVAQFREQTCEPANRPGGFDPHAHRTLQIPVERVGFSRLVIQPPLGPLPSSLVQHRDRLLARVKITSYNHSAAADSAPFFRACLRQAGLGS